MSKRIARTRFPEMIPVGPKNPNKHKINRVVSVVVRDVGTIIIINLSPDPNSGSKP